MDFMRKPSLIIFTLSFLLLIGCGDVKNILKGKDEIVSIDEVHYSDKSAAQFTKRTRISGVRIDSYISNLTFFSPEAPEKTLYRFKHRGPISGGMEYPRKILSPDKKWIVLYAGDIDGFVYCRTDDVVDCVKNDRYEGRFHLDFIPPDPESEGIIVRFLRWEAPATFVFYEEDRERKVDDSPNPDKDIYKINLETGVFTLPPHPSSIVAPYLYKEKDQEESLP